MPPIHNAAKAGDVARVKAALDSGVPVNTKDHVRTLPCAARRDALPRATRCACALCEHRTARGLACHAVDRRGEAPNDALRTRRGPLPPFLAAL